MRLSRLLGITIAAAVTVGGVIIFNGRAAESSQGQRPVRARRLERAREKLGLTDDQVAQIKTQLAGEKEVLKELLTRLHDARVGLREAIQSPQANESSVRAASAKVAAVEADLAVERLKLFGKLSPILTSEQQQKVKAFQSRIDDFLDNQLRAVNRGD